EELKKNADWYKSDQGQKFVKKVVATALNAEYADKLKFLANALVNGPGLRGDDAMRAKFVEMIRQLSKSALEVLVASLRRQIPSGTGQVMPGQLAGVLGWAPELVESCVKELFAFGVFSSTTRWIKSGENYRQAQYFPEGTPAITAFTKSFS